MGSTISPFPTTRRCSSLSLHHGSSDQRSVEVEGKGLDLGEGSRPLMHYQPRRLNRSVPSVGEEKEERISCNNNFQKWNDPEVIVAANTLLNMQSSSQLPSCDNQAAPYENWTGYHDDDHDDDDDDEYDVDDDDDYEHNDDDDDDDEEEEEEEKEEEERDLLLTSCTRSSYVRRAKDKALKNKFRKRDGDGDQVRDEVPTHIGTKNDILPDQIESESRCTRVNGRGWRCQQLAYYGFSLCSHHQLGGRIRNAERVRMRRIGLDAAEVFGKRKKNKNKM